MSDLIRHRGYGLQAFSMKFDLHNILSYLMIVEFPYFSMERVRIGKNSIRHGKIRFLPQAKPCAARNAPSAQTSARMPSLRSVKQLSQAWISHAHKWKNKFSPI